MKLCIIYHSETGNTRHIAQHLSTLCDCQLVDVSDRASYSSLTGFLVRCKRAQCEELVPVEPTSIDVSGYDLLVFGSPVWAFKPTPAIHAAILALKGCTGKKAVVFCTHGGSPGDTQALLKKWLELREMKFCGGLSIHQKDIENDKINGEIRSLVMNAVK